MKAKGGRKMQGVLRRKKTASKPEQKLSALDRYELRMRAANRVYIEVEEMTFGLYKQIERTINGTTKKRR